MAIKFALVTRGEVLYARQRRRAGAAGARVEEHPVHVLDVDAWAEQALCEKNGRREWWTKSRVERLYRTRLLRMGEVTP